TPQPRWLRISLPKPLAPDPTALPALKTPPQYSLATRPWEPAPEPTSYRPSAVPETWEVLDMLSRSTTSDAALGHLEAAVADVAYRYPATPPAESVPLLQRRLVGVHEMLARPQALAARRRGVRILAAVAGLLGLAHHDLGDRGRSEAHFHLGTVAAGEGEAGDLTAWLLTVQSIVEYTAGRRDSAAALLQKAAAHAETAGPRRRAWVTANLARSLASGGDRTSALAALDQAAHDLDLAEDETVGGLDFFTAHDSTVSPARPTPTSASTRQPAASSKPHSVRGRSPTPRAAPFSRPTSPRCGSPRETSTRHAPPRTPLSTSRAPLSSSPSSSGPAHSSWPSPPGLRRGPCRS
ncbi:hypothetical protein ACWC5I_31940, partial [Kitasatospora sp. NPDC001574]